VRFADGTKKMNRGLVKKVAVGSATFVKAVVFHVVVAFVVYFTFNASSIKVLAFQDHWGSSLV
jgi:hypothetical protein